MKRRRARMRPLCPAKAGVQIALLFLALPPALPVSAQVISHRRTGILDFPAVEIEGIVRTDIRTKRVTSADVTLQDDKGQMVDEQSTSGEFHFTMLHKAKYTIVVTAEGYEPFVETVDLTNYDGEYVVNAVLRPNDSADTDSANLPSRTDETAPGKARKEWQKGTRANLEQKTDEAREHFQKAVDIYPCYARAQTDLALALMSLKDSPHSEAPLKKAIQCDPDYVDAYLHLGRLLNAVQRYADAHKALEEGIRRNPASWRLQFHLAQADVGLNNFPLAEQEFERTLSLGPDVSPAVHEKFADLYLKEKAYAKAYSEMQAYLQGAPNGHYVEKVKAVMHQLESAGLAGSTKTAGSVQPPAGNN